MSADPGRARFLRRMSRPHNRLAWTANWELVYGALENVSGTVYDLGCGRSPYRELLSGRAQRIVGVDWSEPSDALSPVDVVADLNQPLPFEQGVADTVTAFHVMEHLQDPAAFIAEIARLLRPGGHLVMTVPFMWGIHEAPHDYFRFTRFGIDHLTKSAGLEVMQIEEGTGFWTMWVLKFNYRTFRSSGRLGRVLWRPVWAVGQALAPRLDRRRPRNDEPGGYLLVASKPRTR